jgi:hypothetical protein
MREMKMTDGELQMAAEVPEDSKAAEVTTFENIFGKLMISEQKWLDLCTGNGQSQDISYLSKIVCFRAQINLVRAGTKVWLVLV